MDGGLVKFADLKPVDRYTRSGQWGKFITCPSCYSVQRVHHFAWSALSCQSCKKMIDKNEWRIHGNGTPYKVSELESLADDPMGIGK